MSPGSLVCLTSLSLLSLSIYLSIHLWVPFVPGGAGCPERDVLKHSVSLLTSAMLFPFLVWGGFVFLPFDAPLLNSTPLRLVYTLRCSVFAAAPVILGE